jgi:hypothetical protein
MAKVDLVFRQVGERTGAVSLELAIRHLRPDRVHILDDVRPFSECVNRMLRIDHDCDYVVYVDADCLILEDMRGFVDRCRDPYVDCYVSDRFRGRIHCGVHITRIDLVRRMAAVTVPEDDLEYVLRPESRLRALAMKPAGMHKQFRNFDILHDHFQYYRHVFGKYALRELRSRTATQLPRLNMAMQRWPHPNDEHDDFAVARHAIDYARRQCPKNRADEVERFIERLPDHAERELARLGIAEKGPLTMDRLEEWLQRHHDRPLFGARADKPKVFGVGLNRTGAQSLTRALQILGFDPLHQPLGAEAFAEIAGGRRDLSLLQHYDGIADVAMAPYYARLDALYPGSKFILTVRDKDSWLRSCQFLWSAMPIEDGDRHRQEVRRFFRNSVYGCQEFVAERFARVYDQHLRGVLEHFRDRPDQLLVLDLTTGDGFDRLAPFLDRPLPSTPFPHIGSALSRRVALCNDEPEVRSTIAA